MTILAYDFDGVICQSANEIALVSLHAYLDLEPRSRLRRTLESIEATDPIWAYDFSRDEELRRLEALTPLGNRAEDFGVALYIVENQLAADDQSAYDAHFQSRDQDWLDSFHKLFYHHRARLRSTSPELWLQLLPAYSWFVALLLQHREDATHAIATAKDGDSVRALLQRYGILEVFSPSLILDKDTGVSKRAHIRELARRLGVEPDEITFLDDKVKHLEDVAALGTRCVLSGWGYNTEREHDRARELGFAVATPATASEVLFQ